MRAALDDVPRELDEALVAQVEEGDERALGTLYDRHGSLVFGLARAIVGSDADAEEVTEDVFMKLWSEAERFDPARGTLRAWLATMTRSRALDFVRARSRRHAAHERASQRSDAGVAVDLAFTEPPDERAQVSEIRATLDHALATLTRDQRRAIELAYFGGLTQSEIAQRLGEPLGTIKTRIRDGLAKLRQGLRAPEGLPT